jgi:hypothetical protein
MNIGPLVLIAKPSIAVFSPPIRDGFCGIILCLFENQRL